MNPASHNSPIEARRHSPAIPQLLQIGRDRRVELRRLRLLLPQRRDEPRHLLLERLSIILLRLRPHVPPRREHVAVLAHLLQRRALAEAGDICVLALLLLAPPGVVSPRDPSDVLIRELPVRAVDHAPHLPGIDEQDLPAPIPELSILPIPREEPQARRNLRRVEELA